MCCVDGTVSAVVVVVDDDGGGGGDGDAVTDDDDDVFAVFTLFLHVYLLVN